MPEPSAMIGRVMISRSGARSNRGTVPRADTARGSMDNNSVGEYFIGFCGGCDRQT